MTAADRQKDHELDLLMDETEKLTKSPKNKKTKIKMGNLDMNKEQFKRTKKAHKAEIAKIKVQRTKLKQDVKKHKLLIKQGKIMYKLGKMKESK